MATATLHLGRGPVWRSVLLAGVIFLGLTHTLLALPTSLVLTMPILGMFTVARLLLSTGRREVLTIILCWVGIGLAALTFGYVHYLAGLLTYTAAGLFTDLSKRPLTLYSGQVSLLLWTPISSLSTAAIFTPERMMVGGGLIGCLAAVWLGSPRQSALALTVALAEAVLIAVGVSNYWLDYWFGPSIWYYEAYLFPYFALYIVFLLLVPLMLVWRVVLCALSAAFQRQIVSFANAAAGLALPLAIGLYARAIGPVVQSTSREIPTFYFASPLPQPESAITRILKSEIRLSPNQPFRGRVAVMTGRIFPEKREWQHYSLVHYFALFATGNLHDGPGLWQDDVPTLMESNTLMTPASFVFLRALLTEPDDSQIRTIMGMRRIDPRILKAIGVRFVITDLPISGTALRAQIPIPVSPKAREMLGFSYRELDEFDLYLYEFDGVNLGQFNPTETKLAADANQALGYLADGETALDRTVVVSEPLSGPLTEAKLEHFTIGRDQYRVRASSTGKSILLLPVEFSRCLKISDAAGGAPRLFRADLMLTGVLFERQIDAQISFHSGPFHDSRCRLEDLAESNRMNMRSAFKDRPAFEVLRPR
jgi:TM2 domain-containing membrane protein YozV